MSLAHSRAKQEKRPAPPRGAVLAQFWLEYAEFHDAITRHGDGVYRESSCISIAASSAMAPPRSS